MSLKLGALVDRFVFRPIGDRTCEDPEEMACCFLPSKVHPPQCLLHALTADPSGGMDHSTPLRRQHRR